MSDASFLYKAKHNNVIVDSRIMLVLVIVYYVLLFIAIYFPHEFTDVEYGGLVFHTSSKCSLMHTTSTKDP
jgi:hypothetical protein